MANRATFGGPSVNDIFPKTIPFGIVTTTFLMVRTRVTSNLFLIVPNETYSKVLKEFSHLIVRVDQLRGSLEYIQKTTGIGVRSKP
jgi:hypothetical protein